MEDETLIPEAQPPKEDPHNGDHAMADLPEQPNPDSPADSNSEEDKAQDNPSNYDAHVQKTAWSYDVFLSFRGEDTRKTFTGHLHEALTRSGVKTFIDDDDLPRGEAISHALLEAIEASRIAVVVFSRHYADSAWCLDEAAKIAECWRGASTRQRQKVLPVFYDVDPSEVRKQTGQFGADFERHEERFGLDRVSPWRAALVNIASLSGWDLRNTAGGHEAKFINKIVEEVTRHLNPYLFVARFPVGIDFRVRNMGSMLGIRSDDNVRMIGIWGMGGVGKTALAKAIYNKYCQNFEGRSFLADVRENWGQPRDRVRLQKQLLFDVLKSKVKVENVDSGVMVIKERLKGKRVLVIIDDVSEVKQLHALASSRDWFGRGSIIIVTTRDKHLLSDLEVDYVHVAYEMSDIESLELFSWHAFKRSNPPEAFSDLSASVVAYSGGLPLALEVLGSYLRYRPEAEWKSALEKLKKIPHKDIQKKLRISYDSLDDDYVKDIFLDIACFFIGKDRNDVQLFLDGCGLHSESGMSPLIQRCFVSISRRNKLMMHDLVRDMGREIIQEKFRKVPEKWSRLCHRDDAVDVLAKDLGTGEIEGLSLKMDGADKSNSFSTKAFTNMKRMRLLQLHYVQLNGSCEHISKELRWLSWHGLQMKFIPNNFYLENLVVMSLKYSNIRQVWKDPQAMEKLKILNLSHSHDLSRTPDFSKLPNLLKLILKDCPSLCEVHHSIGHLHKLVLVNLNDCKILKNLPKSFYKITSLEMLLLSGCTSFRNLDEDLGELKSLRTLVADNTGITKIPYTIVSLRNLEHLSLCGLKASPAYNSPSSLRSMLWSWFMPRKTNQEPLSLLPRSLKGLNSLTDLSLADCNLADGAIPKDIGCLSSLVSLRLQNNNFLSLPSSLGELSKLDTLWIEGCVMLRSLPDLPANLTDLDVTNCTSLEEMPNVSNMSRMQGLNLRNCKKLVEVPGLDNLRNSLHMLDMGGCDNISSSFIEKTLQGWRSLYGIFFPGPDWFAYVDEGNSLHFEVPQSANCYVWAMHVCAECSSSSHQENNPVSLDRPSASVTNYTKGSLILTTGPMTSSVVNTRGNSLWKFHCSIMCKLEPGDEAKVIVDLGPQSVVKKIGANLICVRRDWSHEMIYYGLNLKGRVFKKFRRGWTENSDENDKQGPSEDEFRPKKRALDSDEAGLSCSSFGDQLHSSKRLKDFDPNMEQE